MENQIDNESQDLSSSNDKKRKFRSSESLNNMENQIDNEPQGQSSSDDKKRKFCSCELLNKKQENDSSWDDYFMTLAFFVAKRSKDPVTRVGACIVSLDKKIVSTGYNKMPDGCDDDDFPWCKKNPNELENKQLYVCHAEMNAVLSMSPTDVKQCTMYVTLFPCNECAKIIIQGGIKEVVYCHKKQSRKSIIRNIATERMFNSSGVKFREHYPSNDYLVRDFSNNA